MPASLKTIFSKPAEPAFGGRPLKVVRHATARVMRLRVDPRDGAVRLTLPRRASLRRAYAWVEEQRPWVEAQLAKTAEPLRLAPGMKLEVFGEPVVLASKPSPLVGEGWVGGAGSAAAEPANQNSARSADADRPPPCTRCGCPPGIRSPVRGTGRPRASLPTRGRGLVQRTADSLIIPGDPALFQARALRWLKREALRILEHETRTLAARAGIAVGRVSVGDPRSRWGSCSAAGDIRYSWRLILAPPFVLRSTVAHELAHRVHMNHGPAFKALERDLLGESPTAAREWLRANGASLHRIGART
jgi:predicted metal-dependent hydrolase